METALIFTTLTRACNTLSSIVQAKEKKRTAAKAKKEASKGKDAKSKISFVAAAAKQAAARAEKAGDDNCPPQYRGIAAMGAAAAAAAVQKSIAYDSKFNGGVITATAVGRTTEFATDENKGPSKASTTGDVAALSAAAALKRTQSAQTKEEGAQGGGVPEFASLTTRLDKGSSEIPAYNEKGEPANIDKDLGDKRPDSGGISEFSAKAAAYRKKKGNQEESEKLADDNDAIPEIATAGAGFDKVSYDEKVEPISNDLNTSEKGESSAETRTSFLSSAAAYRRKKSSRNLGAEDESILSRDAVSPLASPKELVIRRPPFERSDPPFRNVKPVDAAVERRPTFERSDPPFRGVRRDDELDIAGSGFKAAANAIEDEDKRNAQASNSLADFFARESKSNSPIQRSPVSKSVRKVGSGLGGFLEKAAPSFDKDNLLDDEDIDDDMSYDPRKNFDESSIAVTPFGSGEKRQGSSRMSDTWARGDTIQSQMDWANKVLSSSDTDSVANFEVSMDLDLNDFDDDSTVATTATYQDDSSVTSATPAKVAASILFDDSSEEDNFAVTPAKVAASILFTDSPASSADNTPAKSNANRGRFSEDSGLDTGYYDYYEDAGLDAGLSFGGDVGLDDGLQFGGYNDDASGIVVPSLTPEPKSPERKTNWFTSQWNANK
jgi:hypothetical protein